MKNLIKRSFVNVYEDEDGRFIGDANYPDYESAYKNRDNLSTYRKTVEVIEIIKHPIIVEKLRKELIDFANHLNTYKGLEEIRFDFMVDDYLKDYTPNMDPF